MQQVFLEEYYTMNRTSEARDAIRAFQQHSGEAFHEAFTRFKELLSKCPHHSIQTWELIKAFYDGLLPDDVRDLITISNGTFLTNTEAADWAYLERQSATSKRQAQSSRRARSASARSVDYEAEERVEKLKQQNLLLERQVAQMKLGKGAEVRAANAFAVCTDCGELGHLVGECLSRMGSNEEVNQVFGERKQYDMKSNTYHPGLRNHPNFSYGNSTNQMNPNFQGNQQGNSSSASGGTSDDKLDAIMKFMKDIQKDNEVRDKTSEAMEKQLGQLAEDLAQLRRDPGKLPSTTTVNPAHQSSSSKNGRNVHINAVSVRPTFDTGSIEVAPPSQVVEEVVEDVDTESDSQHDQESTKLKKSFCEKEMFREVDGKKVKVPYPMALLEPAEIFGLSKRGPPRDKRWENFKQVKINLPLLDAIKENPDQVECFKELSTQKRLHQFPKKLDLTANVNAVLLGTLPPKLQDPGAPIISVQVGEFKIDRALLDLGACVEECYYPVDFLVLDCATSSKNTHPPVILGRPFTAHAIINCVDGTVSMRFGDRELRLNVFSNATDPLITGEHSKAESGEENVSPTKEIHTKHECFMVDRFEVAGSKAVRKKESVAHEEFKTEKGKPRGKKKKKPPECDNAKRRLELFNPMWKTTDDLLEHWRGYQVFNLYGCNGPSVGMFGEIPIRSSCSGGQCTD
ncbi:uncharacterized protein LOC110913634 [Helianthus annuus]|uniref:uncharacterized protein LOC110913634 n=1 Tax=Helianthus annuus TaxID=4232 RepID=UPI000B8FA462|nr:uncharacterized protein LOC110913634 [Helianthus annuus]